MLKKFSGNAHQHLVSLLVTYEQFSRFYLIFHWAEADLENYWKEVNPSPNLDYKTVTWIAQQCEGIADGLTKIHRYRSHYWKTQKRPPLEACDDKFSREASPDPPADMQDHAMEELYGRHGDIKPPNVLWYQDTDPEKMGTLKLADFGLAEFNANYSKSFKRKSKVITTPSYRPPECDLKDGFIGPSYDIWTLGCLYLEFITWLLGGWDLVKDFALQRVSFDTVFNMDTDTFFVILDSPTGEGIAMVKPMVTEVSRDPSHIAMFLIAYSSNTL